MTDRFEDYPCLGICLIDPDSGYCLGCGRPPLPSPEARLEKTETAAVLPETESCPASGD